MTKRNENGVANSCDQYRTVKGVRWNQWASCLTAEAIKQYRTAGVRCCYQNSELYIHPDDTAKATAVHESQGCPA